MESENDYEPTDSRESYLIIRLAGNFSIELAENCQFYGGEVDSAGKTVKVSRTKRMD